jgi:hypothetical protein
MDPENHIYLDYDVGLNSIGFKRLVRYIFDQIPDKQPQDQYRKRLRKALRMVLINLIDLTPSTFDFLAYNRDHNAPTKRRITARSICRAIDAMADMNLIEKRRGFYDRENKSQGRPSRIRATPKLNKLFLEYGTRQNALYRNRQEDKLIQLRDLKDKKNIRFKHTPFTLTAEKNNRDINALLDSCLVTLGDKYTIYEKRLHRIFNGDFEHGGRFFGRGRNWMYMKGRSKTRSLICIDGKATVELDYSAYHLTMLYNRRGLPGKDYGSSGEIREFRKKACLIMLNAKLKEEAIRAIRREVNKGKIKLPGGGTDLRGLLDSFVGEHEPIKQFFYSGIGRRLQNYDSEIAEDILMHFQRQGIPVLPVHDSFIVTAEHEQELSETMERAYFKKFEFNIKVDKK